MMVSVLIGSRNRPRALVRCVRSCLDQDYEPFEVVVLDDASDEVDLCQVLANECNDPRVRCLRSASPLGVAGGRNLLMAEVNGDVLCVIDDDAVFGDRKCLSRIAEAFRKDPAVGILATKVINHDGDRVELFVPFSRAHRRRRPSIVEEEQLVSYYLGTCHAVRRQLIERCGGYQGGFVYGGEELDLSYRAIMARSRIKYVPSIVVHHLPEPSVVKRQKWVRSPELYFHVRNRLLLAYMYLPKRYVPSYVGVWVGYYLIRGLREFALGDVLRGIAKGLRDIRTQKRAPLTADAVAYLQRHHGRLWY